MSVSAVYGSLDDLVTAALADFARCGVDCLTKLTLLELAWTSPTLSKTAEQYAVLLGGTATPDGVSSQLEQLVTAGLLSRDDTGRYRLVDSPMPCETLARLRDFWADPARRALASAQLRYRMA